MLAGLCELSGACWYSSFQICCSVYTLCLFGMSASFQTYICVCVKFQKVGRRLDTFSNGFELGCLNTLSRAQRVWVRGAVELV